MYGKTKVLLGFVGMLSLVGELHGHCGLPTLEEVHRNISALIPISTIDVEPFRSALNYSQPILTRYEGKIRNLLQLETSDAVLEEMARLEEESGEIVRLIGSLSVVVDVMGGEEEGWTRVECDQARLSIQVYDLGTRDPFTLRPSASLIVGILDEICTG